MATRKPDFFNVTDGKSGISSYVTTVIVHLHKVFWYELDSTFIKGKCMSEMACACYGCRICDMNVLLDETQRRHRVPVQNQFKYHEKHIARSGIPDAHEMNPHTTPTEVFPELYCGNFCPDAIGVNGKVAEIGPVAILINTSLAQCNIESTN